MSLKERISEDMKAAMRAKDSERLSTIRMLQAAIKQREVDERVVLDDAAVIAIVDKLIKQRKDSVVAFEQGGRPDLVAKESAEITVLEAYVPQRLSAEQIGAEIAALVAELGAAGPGDMGRVMAAAKTRLAGKAEMALVSAAVKQALAK
ncbi:MULTISPECIES: GatB/YqeY domain-containing protein [Rubrivivax]|uniref:GatB/YqeY domain-containing protein n=1 Tax=Rubrivivax benzoatilyticus TaxID=316997 RepID=A0ABX0HUZ6_9BURK|nr:MULTISPECIES: GatB/YqeY domain-containing protein [Rubrivivax]EGJ11152.1 GatB/YqeY domain-containing protein [Rubrivivax benzoatilyticus JA2 = ATCC BAA-35]MCD0418271.1 GatB/YqeY domain-containing protein [Rubrivivax sp. JA1024]NHK97617.1 GatB/YqeY domain-containing protein [Rubrivivax benzoatilyticus]NHL22688.1 GatB/YqeY domain-containing protein [Rubrivivax benzoatilyticus]